MSRAAKEKHRMRTMARTWSGWREIEVTDELRAGAPHLKHLWKSYINSRFQCDCFQVASPVGGIVQVIIARIGQLEDVTWPDVMRIKTELFGTENFAIELYPNERVDVAMKTRIVWIMPAGWAPPCGLHLDSAWGGQ